MNSKLPIPRIVSQSGTALAAVACMALLVALSGCTGSMVHPGPDYFQSKRIYTEDSLGVSLGEPTQQMANRAKLPSRETIVRGQQPAPYDDRYEMAWGEQPSSNRQNEQLPGTTNFTRGPMQGYDVTNASGFTVDDSRVVPAGVEFSGPPVPTINQNYPTQPQQNQRYQQPANQPYPGDGQPIFQANTAYQGGGAPVEDLPPPNVYNPNPNPVLTPGQQPFFPPSVVAESQMLRPDGTPVDLNVLVDEARTGRFMFGVGVNSDAGLTGQVVIDERNFDATAIPTSFQDWVNGTAFRGNGQGFRLEAMPGSQVQRYLVNFTEPYLFDTRVSFNVSGYYYERFFFDWDEQRVGGRLGLGYSLAPDLSVNAALRMENVDISDPRVATVPELNAVLGETALYTARFTVAHDTRDSSFAATEGYLLELSYEQGFGDFVYPRGEIDYRRYFLLRERPDGSGRHTLSYNFRFGFSGGDTPIYENYFAGGYSTIRGYEFRGASPEVNGVEVGGEFRFLGSAEYMFPLTADDMMKGVVFCDFGTVEEEIEFNADNYRVAPGFGLRIFVPAMGPAPIALDFAFPVLSAPTDDEQMFSFFVGFGR